MRAEVAQIIANLPRKPGVYIMRATGREVVYIGKATDLRSRVRSYFSGNDPRFFVPLLESLLTDVEVVITQNAKEALLLENALIKKHQPRFNVKLRDDKNYLSLRVDLAHPWPRVEFVRAISDDGARYFGPYHSAQSVRRTLTTLNRFFHLRTCSDQVLMSRKRPCLQYQIKRCPGPCVFEIDRDAYLDDVRHAILFLEGKETELVDELAERMQRASEHLEFELAAQYRDQIRAVQRSLTKQSAVQTSPIDRDIVGAYRQGEAMTLTVMKYRDGELRDVDNFALDEVAVPTAIVLTQLLTQVYGEESNVPPREVLLSEAPSDTADIEAALSELRGSRCEVLVPQRGDKKDLVDLASTNAHNHFEEELSTRARKKAALVKLGRALSLEAPPRVMECYDISNFQGTHIVGSQVTFVDGVPDKTRYRKYRIRSTDGQDDFASMFEVLARRARRARESEDDAMPDLIVIDGGKGQLGMAVAALQDLGLHDQRIISLAKSRTTGVSEASGASTRSDERVFVPGRKNPVVLRQTSDALYLLAHLRDEAHRFAIEFHRSLRRKSTLRSQLDDIDGVGPARRSALLRHFGSLKKIRDASLEDLEGAPRLTRHVAWAVYDHFHPGEADAPGPEDP